jgi:hypothetical protein
VRARLPPLALTPPPAPAPAPAAPAAPPAPEANGVASALWWPPGVICSWLMPRKLPKRRILWWGCADACEWLRTCVQVCVCVHVCMGGVRACEWGEGASGLVCARVCAADTHTLQHSGCRAHTQARLPRHTASRSPLVLSGHHVATTSGVACAQCRTCWLRARPAACARCARA